MSVGITPTRGALEQPSLKIAFQPADLHAQRRLHDIEPPRRFGDAALLVQDCEILDLTQIHRPVPDWLEWASVGQPSPLENAGARQCLPARGLTGRPASRIRTG
jgi:hypothetical protein